MLSDAMKGQVEQLVARLFSYSDSRYTLAVLDHPNAAPQRGPQAVQRNGQSSCYTSDSEIHRENEE